MSCGINERPKGPKPAARPMPQSAFYTKVKVSNVAMRIPMSDLPVWDNITGPSESSNCRNCGAAKFKQGKCEYCGTNQ